MRLWLNERELIRRGCENEEEEHLWQGRKLASARKNSRSDESERKQDQFGVRKSRMFQSGLSVRLVFEGQDIEGRWYWVYSGYAPPTLMLLVQAHQTDPLVTNNWYFWFPLYALASAVNLINSRRICNKSRRIRQMTRTALSLGLFLLVKVITEDVITERVGIFSLDLTHRVVREKIGSGLVIASMVLQLQASCSKRKEKSVDFGMAATVIFGYGLPFWFFTIQNGEIKI
ncbi:unnamed protein product [Brassica napus]|uniref:(rape) hypothetical protein n=1 Tax=Brassica napus TaxID=3708 RepID=A0A816PJT1_BRANA|nr:unnamed protein product [Brassica napus]